jgi:hypothetical protein
MPGRSTRDEKQAAPEPGSIAGVLHQFGKSIGLVKDVQEPPPTSPVPPKTEQVKASSALETRNAQIDRAVDDAAK